MADAGGMLCLPTTQWQNDHCRFISPSVYGTLRLRCNHSYCAARAEESAPNNKRPEQAESEHLPSPNPRPRTRARRLARRQESSDDEDLQLDDSDTESPAPEPTPDVEAPAPAAAPPTPPAEPLANLGSLVDDDASCSESDVSLSGSDEADSEDEAFVDDSEQPDHMAADEIGTRASAVDEIDARREAQREALQAQREAEREAKVQEARERAERQRQAAEARRREAEEQAARDAAEAAQQAASDQASRDAEEQSSEADTGAFLHLVVLKNHPCPRIVGGIYQSGSALSFTHDGTEIFTAGNSRTAGFSRSPDMVTVGLTTYCLALVDTVTHGEEAGLTWQHENDLPHSQDTIMTIGNLKPLLDALDTPPTTNQMLGTVNIVETRISPTIHAVPDLRPYLQAHVPLLLEADCATQKSRRIFGWLREMLRFNPKLRVMVVSCRIVHAIDVHSDLIDMGFGLYSDRNDRDQPETSRSRVVCQLNSIIHYAGESDYDVVILDEVVSILAYFSLDNHTLSSRDGRKTYMQHISMLQRLCQSAQFLLMADAHMSMDERVTDFLQGVVPRRTVHKVVLQGKNPACMRTLSITYSRSATQSPAVMTDAVRAVLQDPEQRIAVFCASKRLLADELRAQGSYESALRDAGLDKMVLLHGDVGEVDKRRIFNDLDNTLRDCQAFLANGSLTVGANPAVDFGVVYVHMHRNAALVRDMFQLIQRVGRSSETGRGKLHNPVIHIVIHDASVEQKNAERQAKIAKGQIVAPLPTFEESLSKVRDVVQSRKKGNSSRLRNAPIAPAAAGTFPAAAPLTIELPEWVIRVSAWCDFEAQRRDAMMTEEVLKYAQHHSWAVTVAEEAPADESRVNADLVSPRDMEYRFATLMNNHAYGAVYELVTARPLAAEDKTVLDGLLAGENETRLTSRGKAITDAFYKVYLPYNEWIAPEELAGTEIATTLWKECKAMDNRAVQRVQELHMTAKYGIADMFDPESGTVDLSVELKVSRIEPGIALRNALGLPSLVDEWTLPPQYIDIINKQFAGNGIVDSPTELYKIFSEVPSGRHRRITMPVHDRKGSSLYNDLKTVMHTYGMEPNMKPSKARPGRPSTVPKDFGFVPIGGAEWADRRHVNVGNNRVSVEEAVARVELIEENRVQDMLRAEFENLVPLGNIVIPGEYTEVFSASRLKKLSAHVDANANEFAQRFGKSLDSVSSLQRDIAKLLVVCDSDEDEATMAVSYHHKFPDLGRRYATAPAFQTLDGGLRKLIASPFYWDLDFENCYPVLLTSICASLGKPGGTPILSMFVHQREELFRRIMQFYNCSRKAAKQLVIKHLHGGKVRQWLVDWKIAEDICARVAQSGHCRIVMDLETESADIAAFFLDSFPEFKSLLEKIQAQERANGVQPRNMSGPMTALAHGLATFEDRLLKHLETFLRGKGYRIDSLEFDGLKVFRDGNTAAFPEAVLREAEQYLAEQDIGGGTHTVRVAMKLAEKPMTSPYEPVLDEEPPQPMFAGCLGVCRPLAGVCV